MKNKLELLQALLITFTFAVAIIGGTYGLVEAESAREEYFIERSMEKNET